MRRGRKHWERVVGELEHSGLTQRAFAEQRGIKLGTLHHWVYRVRNDVVATESVRLLPVRVQLEPGTSERWLELRVRQDVVLRFPEGTDGTYLAHLLAMLGEPRRC